MKATFVSRPRSLRHRLLRWYRRGPNHPAKLRFYCWILRLPLFRRAVVDIDDVTFDLDLGDYIQHQIFVDGAYEPRTYQLFLSLIEAGDLVIDVGANIGQYALGAGARIREEGSVIAIVPNPNNASQLLSNRRASNLIGVVDIVLAAVSQETQPIEFMTPPPAAQGTSRAYDGRKGAETYWAPTIRLADLLSSRGDHKIRVMKVDVEGAERGVLKSLFEFDGPLPQNIIIEYIPESFSYSEVNEENIIDYISSKGYELLNIDGSLFEGVVLVEENLWARRIGETL